MWGGGGGAEGGGGGAFTTNLFGNYHIVLLFCSFFNKNINC